MTSLPIPALLLCALFAGCSFSFPDSRQGYVGQSSYQLAEFTDPGGKTEVYDLTVRAPGVAKVQIRRTEPRRYPDLGLELRAASKGLLVQRVNKGSPAAAAGIEPDDIILAINGTPTRKTGAYHDLMDSLPADQPVSVQLRGEETPRSVRPEPRVRTVRTQESCALETPSFSNPRTYAGMNIGAIPAQHSRRIFGDDRNALVITGITLGSPVYLAGLRTGDVIERVNDRPAPTVEELMRLIREEGPGREIDFEVTRESSRPFRTTVLLEDVQDTTDIYIPFTLGVEGDAQRSRWWFGPLATIASYRNTYLASKTREPKESGSYSMLLGLFKHSWSSGGSRTRLLWFLSFDF